METNSIKVSDFEGSIYIATMETFCLFVVEVFELDRFMRLINYDLGFSIDLVVFLLSVRLSLLPFKVLDFGRSS